jgi:hypothetical protein
MKRPFLAARTTSLDDGLMLIYDSVRTSDSNLSRALTFPTASPTKSFILISRLLLKLVASSGESGPTTEMDPLCELTSVEGSGRRCILERS